MMRSPLPPRMQPEFRAPFLTHSGWGTYIQQAGISCSLTCACGEVRLQRLTLPATLAGPLTVQRGEETLPCKQEACADQIILIFEQPVALQAGTTLNITNI